MNTHTSVWKKDVGLPVIVAAVAVSIVASLLLFERVTGLSASVRGNPVYGTLPVHSAAPSQFIRRTASTSSMKSLTPNAQKRLRARARQHEAAQRSSAR